MPSAACYTNRRRVLAESSVTKVEYPGKIAVNDAILSVQNCSPNFQVLFYRSNPSCRPCKPTPSIIYYYSGGGAFTNPSTGISGGNAFSNPPAWISGGNAGSPTLYSGGNAFSNPSSGISGGSANT